MQAKVNGVTLYYKSVGAGFPVLLLHGNGEDHHIFDALSAKLKDNFTVYAIDSRNHGQSDVTDDYRYETMAEDIYALIQELSLAPVNIVGFSDGAIISLLLAMKYPKAIRKMVLLGINLSPEDFTEENYNFLKDTYQKTNDPLFRLMLEQPNIDIDDVREVKVPALVVAAENDVFKPEMFERLTAALPEATLTIMKGHEHDSYVIGEDILYPELLSFFK